MRLFEENAVSRSGPAAPRRVAMISEHASPLAAPGSIDSGGQNVYVAHVAGELAQAGWQVDIFTRRDSTLLAPVVQWRDNIRVIHVPAGPPHHVRKEDMLPHMDAFAGFICNFARGAAVPYGIVHANFFMSGLAAQKLKRELAIPFVITFHALGQVRRRAQGQADAFPPERLAIEQALMRDADRIIAECPQDLQDMVQLYDANPARIDIAPCGFDCQELWPLPPHTARARLGLPGSAFIVLQLGRIVPRKGVDTVVRSLALLRQHYGIHAMLLVAGGEGSPSASADSAEMVRLRTLARTLDIGEHVQFAGRQPRSALRYFYSAADVFVTTPWYEPFGITPVEAMACARPVIGSAVGGIKSTVLDGSTGFLVPARDPAAVADRLALLYRDPVLANRMGETGMRRAFEHYTWRAVTQQIIHIYTTAITAATAMPGTHCSPASPGAAPLFLPLSS